MSGSHNCPCTPSCPLQRAMEMLGGKWKMAILCSINANGAVRYNDLKRSIKGISNTMLAKSLKELEEDGLVVRTEYMEVPIRVEYAPTEKVKSLTPILAQLAKWAST